MICLFEVLNLWRFLFVDRYEYFTYLLTYSIALRVDIMAFEVAVL